MGEKDLASVSTKDLEGYLAFLRQTLGEARAIILQMMQEQYATETKADQSFVTDVDMAVEKMIRSRVSERFPDHGVLGEELPTLNPDSAFRWITDPVDGTQNLVHGLPTFGAILGLHFEGKPLVGGIDHPMLDLQYTAALGLGAWENEKRLRIEDSTAGLDLNEIVALATRAMFERSGEGKRFDDFMAHHPSTRVFYDCFSTTRVVAGQVGALAEFNVRIWDLAATEILVTEAGGVYEEVKQVAQPEGKEALRCVLMGKPSVVEAIRPFFT